MCTCPVEHRGVVPLDPLIVIAWPKRKKSGADGWWEPEQVAASRDRSRCCCIAPGKEKKRLKESRDAVKKRYKDAEANKLVEKLQVQQKVCRLQ